MSPTNGFGSIVFSGMLPIHSQVLLKLTAHCWWWTRQVVSLRLALTWEVRLGSTLF